MTHGKVKWSCFTEYSTKIRQIRFMTRNDKFEKPAQMHIQNHRDDKEILEQEESTENASRRSEQSISEKRRE